MGLVYYDSDSDDESDRNNTQQSGSSQIPIPDSLASAIQSKPTSSSSLFAALPAPKGRLQHKKIILEAPQVPDIKDDGPPEPKTVPARSFGSGLSALLPAPKRTLPTAAGKSSVVKEHDDTSTTEANGTSLMQKRDDQVRLSGSNTAFRPKHLKSSTPAAAPSSTTSTGLPHTTAITSAKRPAATALDTPPPRANNRASLFSIPTSRQARVTVSGEEEDSYTPILATDARPRSDVRTDAVAQPIIEPMESAESYRYDPSIDYTALLGAHEENDPVAPKKRRRQDFAPPASMREYDAGTQYAENQAFIYSGAAVEAAPVRFVGGGKHQLSSLLNLAHSQKDALEESFAQQKRSMRDSKSKYGR